MRNLKELDLMAKMANQENRAKIIWSTKLAKTSSLKHLIKITIDNNYNQWHLNTSQEKILKSRKKILSRCITGQIMRIQLKAISPNQSYIYQTKVTISTCEDKWNLSYKKSQQAKSIKKSTRHKIWPATLCRDSTSLLRPKDCLWLVKAYENKT